MRSELNHLRRPCAGSRAFTLTEVLISVALSLVLILGINQIFKVSATTISTGMALSDAVRAQRAARSTLSNDFAGYDETSGIVPSGEMPCLIVRSANTPGYRDRNEQASGVGPSQYRTDMLSFFARGAFKRQTGQNIRGETFICDMNPPPNEAWIVYGHAMLPNNNTPPNDMQFPAAGADYFSPGAADATLNPNNYYVNNWVLARMAMLLKPRNLTYDSAQQPCVFIDRPAGTPPENLSPLAINSAAVWLQNMAPHSVPGVIQQSIFDLAGTTISDYRMFTQAAQTASPGGWMWPLVYRFNCNPFPPAHPNSKDMALTVPYFLGGCARFIVEFAGDFVTQNPDGTYQTNLPDSVTDTATHASVLDYKIVGTVRQIRWYGLLRDIDGDGTPDVNTVSHSWGLASPLSFEKGIIGTTYTCAWGPAELPASGPSLKPAMIRITIQVVDPNGRLPDGLTQEYIFKIR